MPHFRWLLILLAFLSLLCSSNKSFSDAEKAKLDPYLSRLLTGQEVDDSKLDVQELSDGTKIYAVIVRSNNVEEIKATGANVSSDFGDVKVVKASLKQLHALVKLQSVQSIQTGTTNYPQPHH